MKKRIERPLCRLSSLTVLIQLSPYAPWLLLQHGKSLKPLPRCQLFMHLDKCNIFQEPWISLHIGFKDILPDSNISRFLSSILSSSFSLVSKRLRSSSSSINLRDNGASNSLAHLPQQQQLAQPQGRGSRYPRGAGRYGPPQPYAAPQAHGSPYRAYQAQEESSGFADYEDQSHPTPLEHAQPETSCFVAQYSEGASQATEAYANAFDCFPVQSDGSM